MIYDRTYHMTLITAGACRIRPTPRVSVIVTDHRRHFIFNAERFHWIKKRLMRKAYLSADVVLAVSEGARLSAIEFHPLPPEKIQTFYNLFDVEHIDRQAAAELPQNLHKDDGRFLAIAAGRLHSQKGYDVLIEAVRQVVWEKGRAELELWILGEGDPRQSLELQIREGNLEQHVRLLGFQENPYPFMRAADLFCLSSRYEGMPNALVEAMLCGTPVLSADCQSGPREILQNGQLGRLVPRDDPKAFADGIMDAMLHPADWKRLTPIARQRIEEKFSMTSGIHRLEDILQKASAKRRSTRLP